MRIRESVGALGPCLTFSAEIFFFFFFFYLVYYSDSCPTLHHSNCNQSDSLHKLNRPQHVILFRLRTGHDRLNAHMNGKFKVDESEMYPCNADIMTTEHLLQHCQLHDAVRRDMWPEPIPLRVKLYGNLEELRRTADTTEGQLTPLRGS